MWNLFKTERPCPCCDEQLSHWQEFEMSGLVIDERLTCPRCGYHTDSVDRPEDNACLST